MFSKSRKAVALGVMLAVGVAGMAFATVADDNDARVIGKVNPAKLDKKKFKPVNLTLGVRNSDDWFMPGLSELPESEFIEVSKNVKINLNKRPRCKANISEGTPTSEVLQRCPKKSVIGTGKAEVSAGPPAGVIGQLDVTVLNGPQKGRLRLHAYSQPLGVAPIIPARIVKAKTKGYGQALSVPNAPDTGGLLITLFQAKIGKKTGIAMARCKQKQIKFKRTVTYGDGSSESVTSKQKCTVKKKRK
ncbi:MAG TPA: hypothetical protein VIL04_06270 [Solirubrobacterales bacterium]